MTLTDVYEAPVQSRPIVYVRSTAGAGGDGQSWSTAYKHLRDALSNVLNGSDIWVAGGTHKPSASNSKTTYFTINSKDLRLFGGFAGNETSLSQRSLSSNETILSADYLGNDAEIYNSSAFGDNAYHVFVISDSNVTLSGLTIRGGNAKVANGEDSGGGINASNNSILIVESCKLESNYAVSYGGGISTTSNTVLHMKNSILQNNYNGYNGGGGMSLWGGENEIFNSIFNNNDGSQVGAVLLHAGATSANFNNCLFVNNDGWSKRWAGAGALNLRTTSSVNNCTFYNNSFADSSAKGDLECTSTVTVTNSIFWHPTKSSNLVGGEGTLQLSHSIVKGGALGTSVSTQDPLFLNSSNLKGSDGLSFTNDDGFQLNHNSPAYNAGLPTSMLSDAVDLDQDGNITEPTPFDLAGNSRVMGAVLDIGAYEFLTSNTTPTDLNATAPLSVAENQPIGSVVGEFNATDPDSNATLTYHLVSGAGDGNNSLFTLETNGTLKTATTFDYETNASTYSIRVQAKDEFNATVEGNFTVMLTDLNEPVSHGIKDGLALYYSFDETNGSLVVDGSSNLRNGNLINGTLNTSGKFGSGVEFDNLAHAKIDLGVNQLALPNNWTISTWFSTPLDDTFVDFRHALTSSGTNAHVVLDQAGSKDLGVFNGTFSSTGFGATSLASGWHHIVARGSGEQTSFWIDGVAVGTVNAKVVSAVEVVGNLSGGFGRFSDKLDDFRIYDRALSGTEVIILYGGGNGDFFPYDIQLSNQVVLENSAVGTIIGQVGINSASHSPYQFTLIGGKGDSHNSFFQLDGNGTLKTNSLIDYESHPNLSFRVNVRDKDNRNLEKYFNVQVTDVLEYPIYSGFDGNGSTQITVLENTRNIIPMPFSYPPDGNLTFTIGGVDALRFEPVGNQGFRFIGLPDFEFPLDQGGDNVYDLNLTASYPNNLSTSRLLSVQVLDANETSWTFTNASATGRNGPTQAQLDLAYANTPLEGKVTSLQGIQQWTPPGRGTYYVRAFGGAGSLSGSNRGKGALVAGKFTLEHNDTVTMAIGQLGTSTAGPGGGGGGGSFFVLNGVPMLIAGGGGGHGGNKDSLNSAAHAPITENGLTSNNSYQGGTQGNGGNGADAGGGGGFLTDGQNGSQATGGKSFVNGAQGGYKTAGIYGGDGGFGGGGGGKYKDGNLYGSLHDGGGGGGYSGGGGGVSNTGGGGGSYNIGLDPLGLAGHHSSHGYIEITLLAESSSLSDLNSSAPLTIAENQPVGTIVGEFNATDSDANASLTYYLVSGAGDGNNSLFSLDTNGTLKTATVFDYETNASTYSIRVQAKDEHNATVEGNFTVTLTDVFDNQAPGAISIQFASLTENQPIGTVVGKLNAVDPEAGLVRYALINGSGSSGNQFFTVDPTGVLRTAVVFDFEQNASHSIRGRAMDEFNASREEVLNIQVSNQWEDPDGDGLENSYDPDDDNDGFSDIVEIAYGSDPLDPNSLPNRAPSEISLSPDRVEENMPIGTMVGQLRTIDGDDPNGTGVYQYSFITNDGSRVLLH